MDTLLASMVESVTGLLSAHRYVIGLTGAHCKCRPGSGTVRYTIAAHEDHLASVLVESPLL